MNLSPRHNMIRFLPLLLLCCGLLLPPGPARAAEVAKTEVKGIKLQVSFQYLLANFSGPVRSQWARLAFDPTREELYTLDPASNRISIFSPEGMEIFSFGDQGDAIRASDLAVAEDGSIYLLGRGFRDEGLQHLDYRGVEIGRIRPAALPTNFADFAPDRLKYRQGNFYLLDRRQLKLLVLDAEGAVLRHHDLATQINRIAAARNPERDQADGSQADQSVDTEITGFSVAPGGDVFLTVATLFSAFKLPPGGELEAFGTAGSGPGKFGVVSGIAVDADWIYVADRLRSAVLIFNHDYVFQGEFGYRGRGREDMIVPDDLALNPARHQIFVAQAANKGVGVYQIAVLPP